MSKYCLPFALLFLGEIGSAQTTDFNTVIQPVDFKAKDFSEFLVQLAWLNQPENAIRQAEIKQAKDELRLVKKDWMKDIQMTVNLNEANLASSPTLPKLLYNNIGTPILDANNQTIPIGTVLFDDAGNPISLKSSGGSAFYPRYNFGMNINLGNILSQKNKNQIKQHDVKIAELKLNEQKLMLRAEVLTRFQQYKLSREILKSRTQVEQDANASFLLIKELYSKDERTFEDYNEASSAYFEARESRMKAEAEVMFAKIRLEEIVGLKWEQVQHPQKDQE